MRVNLVIESPNVATRGSAEVGLGIAAEQCRAEIALVLASDAFRRSPKLSRLLAYLCEKQLSGCASQITEYAIALEVLGRGPQFNPQQDAVVRVDLHHLRKRLKDFYAGPGADRPFQIQIPSGQYAPQFVFQTGLAAPVEAPQSPAIDAPPLHQSKWLAVSLFSILLICGAVGLYRIGFSAPRKPPVAIAPGGDEIRIAAGDSQAAYVDSAGRTWLPDRDFTGGIAFHRTVPILRTADPELFQNGREGQFVYSIPLRPGSYELHLYFAETAVTSDTLRSVNIAINGQPASVVDIASDAGGIDTATMKVFKDVSPAKDGFLRIMFQGGESKSFLNAIEIVPGMAGAMRPVRIVAGDRAYRDHLGQVWLPDQWSSGGRKSARAVPIESTADPALYQWERVGHFTYSIPVAEGGLYTVALHFSETWFTQATSSGGIGSRVFDVYCNGSTLLKNFDILKETGGAGGRAVVRTFRHIPASPQGKIVLNFVPVSNYALINAIEVIPE